MTEIEVAGPTGEDRPRPDGGDVRKVTRAEAAPVARSLAQAFYEDPHMRWIFRDDASRMQRLENAFTTFISRVWLREDETYTHERLIGAAAWMPPDTWRLSPLGQVRLLPATLRVVRGDLPRLLKLLTFAERRHPREPRHWYLPTLGVATAWQGRGYGTALLRPVLERCDAERVPAYLEASTPRNRALYMRNGFEVVEECRYADDGPPLWRMWREPAARG